MVRRMVSVFVALVVMSLAVQAAAEEVLFSYGFEAGSSNRYRVKLSQEMFFGGNTIGQIADFEVTVKCLSVTESKAAMELTFDKADMSRQMFGNMAADPLAEAIIGKKVSFSVDPNGEVTDIAQSGYYEGWERMQPFVEPVLESWYVHLPGNAYSPGGEWDHAKKDKGTGGMDVATTAHYKYKENKKEDGRDCASVAGDVKSVLSGQSVNPMGTFKVDGAGKGKFEFLFDHAAKLMVKVKVKMDVNMDLTPAEGGDTVDASVAYQLERELL